MHITQVREGGMFDGKEFWTDEPFASGRLAEKNKGPIDLVFDTHDRALFAALMKIPAVYYAKVDNPTGTKLYVTLRQGFRWSQAEGAVRSVILAHQYQP